MAIKLVDVKRHHVGEPDYTAVVAICDVCGEQLEDASWGLYAWGMPELLGQPFPYGEPLDFYTVHKSGYRRDCLGELETRLGRENVLTEELRYLPIYLARNLGMEIDG